MKVYESIIEIAMEPTFTRLRERNDELLDKLVPLRKTYCGTAGWKAGAIYSDEKALIDLLFWRAKEMGGRPASSGYVGNARNCVFSLLYGLFGIDVIAFLFDQAWVPAKDIVSFSPESFLDRLSVLERFSKKLKDGDKTPVRLQEARAYIRPGMGPQLKCFREDLHRLLLDNSLLELREFGELGVSLQRAGEEPNVAINIYHPYEEHDPEILKSAK